MKWIYCLLWHRQKQQKTVFIFISHSRNRVRKEKKFSKSFSANSISIFQSNFNEFFASILSFEQNKTRRAPIERIVGSIFLFFFLLCFANLCFIASLDEVQSFVSFHFECVHVTSRSNSTWKFHFEKKTKKKKTERKKSNCKHGMDWKAQCIDRRPFHAKGDNFLFTFGANECNWSHNNSHVRHTVRPFPYSLLLFWFRVVVFLFFPRHTKD